MATFSYTPDYSAQITIEPRVSKLSFGDGYEARWSDGLNNMMEKWTLKFTKDKTTANTIMTFFKARQGRESFWWTTPNGDTLAFVCSTFSKTIDDVGKETISAEFKQVPEIPV